MGGSGAFGKVAVALFTVAGSLACAHTGQQRAERPALAAGKYAVESIRSRATLDGIDQVFELSEAGTRIKDGNGAEHTLTERGALLLEDSGACRLALAVSVDGEAPGVSDRSCTWSAEGDTFVLGDSKAEGTRTLYRVKHLGGRLVLEGQSDIDADGKIVGDAKGERLVLVEGAQGLASKEVDRTSEERAAREASEMLNEL
jgi:hypothetical protein